jgi:hypothetical protein
VVDGGILIRPGATDEEEDTAEALDGDDEREMLRIYRG